MLGFIEMFFLQLYLHSVSVLTLNIVQEKFHRERMGNGLDTRKNIRSNTKRMKIQWFSLFNMSIIFCSPSRRRLWISTEGLWAAVEDGLLDEDELTDTLGYNNLTVCIAGIDNNWADNGGVTTRRRWRKDPRRQRQLAPDQQG